MKQMGIGIPPKEFEHGGLMFTPYEVEQAYKRWISRKLVDPLDHPAGSNYIAIILESESRAKLYLKQATAVIEDSKSKLDAVKGEILTKIGEKQEIQREIKHQIHLKKDTENQLRIEKDIVKAQMKKTESETARANNLQRKVDRYELRYKTIRGQIEMNVIQRFVAWAFRI